jgi:hypothetical protein
VIKIKSWYYLLLLKWRFDVGISKSHAVAHKFDTQYSIFLTTTPITLHRMRVVLGSSSKWRQNLFKKHFPEHFHEGEVLVFPTADIDEKAIRHSNVETMVVRIAQAKADTILAKWDQAKRGQEPVLLLCLDQVK